MRITLGGLFSIICNKELNLVIIILLLQKKLIMTYLPCWMNLAVSTWISVYTIYHYPVVNYLLLNCVFFLSVGKPLKSLPDLLQEYNLPPGLFPQNITCYEFDETKAKLIVYLPSVCEVSFKDSSVMRYATRVKAILMRGKLTGIEGMKTKVLVWVKVTSVAVESYKSDKVWFTAGVKKSRPRIAYDVAQAGVRVEEFWV